ncbi:1037_t:CDS:2, partial [Ambispora gerdemannii]
ARISMVKEDKARTIEDLLIRMAQTGQLLGKVGESQLIDLLEQINQQKKPETKIVYNRRNDYDSDEEDYNV